MMGFAPVLSFFCSNESWLVDAEDEGAARKRARAVAIAANRAKRESKMIPNLIFAIEDYEKQLIRLSKTGMDMLLL